MIYNDVKRRGHLMLPTDDAQAFCRQIGGILLLLEGLWVMCCAASGKSFG